MMETQFRISQDIPGSLTILVSVAIAIAVSHHCLTFYRRAAPRMTILVGVAAYLALAMALLRPVALMRKGRTIGPKVTILVDASRRLGLAANGRTRAAQSIDAVNKLLKHFQSARIDVATFGVGGARLVSDAGRLTDAMGHSETSDLPAALNNLVELTGERPSAVIVVTDGRLTRPESVESIVGNTLPVTLKGVPLYGVNIGGNAIPDASIRTLSGLGQAVAHQAFSLRVEIACSGGLSCRGVSVQVRELERGKRPHELAQSTAELSGKESAVLDFNLVLERAGNHILLVTLAHQQGDQVPENDSRFLLFNVARDRVRLLHIAGSPSYDVRELRRWLKGNASVDLVSFFILRTDEDEPNSPDDSGELSLIPFPVDELFSQHLSSFDAVILQDIDAARYHLDVHLDRLARYVEEGGGLILVGGPSAFSGGSYAHSALERVLPTMMVISHSPFDSVEFVPNTTPIGQQAPILTPLRRLLGDRLPSFPGANILGPPKPDARVIWVHPQRSFLPVRGQSVSGGPMPLLAIRDVNDGRTVALGLDATYRLAWGSLAAESSGRAYGALWEGVLGWVMHEPRFEPFRGELMGPCVQGSSLDLRWIVPLGARGELSVDVEPMEPAGHAALNQKHALNGAAAIDMRLDSMPEGAYAALARINSGLAARLDFACERGGMALADSRPDAERLQKLTKSTGGFSVNGTDITNLPIPQGIFVDQIRTSKPIAPSWLWSLLAAVLFGATWFSARRVGLR